MRPRKSDGRRASGFVTEISVWVKNSNVGNESTKISFDLLFLFHIELDFDENNGLNIQMYSYARGQMYDWNANLIRVSPPHFDLTETRAGNLIGSRFRHIYFHFVRH